MTYQIKSRYLYSLSCLTRTNIGKTIKVQNAVTTLKISHKKEVYTKKTVFNLILKSQQSDRRSYITRLQKNVTQE